MADFVKGESLPEEWTPYAKEAAVEVEETEHPGLYEGFDGNTWLIEADGTASVLPGEGGGTVGPPGPEGPPGPPGPQGEPGTVPAGAVILGEENTGTTFHTDTQDIRLRSDGPTYLTGEITEVHGDQIACLVSGDARINVDAGGIRLYAGGSSTPAIEINTGSPYGTLILMQELPPVDPGTNGALWVQDGALMVSQG